MSESVAGAAFSTMRLRMKDKDLFTREMTETAVMIHKAVVNAAKIEGQRAKNELQSQIMMAAPGGSRHAPLSQIRRAQRKMGERPLPLVRLVHAIRYATMTSAGGKQTVVRIGFGGPGRARVSRSWMFLAGVNTNGERLPLGEYNAKSFSYPEINAKLRAARSSKDKKVALKMANAEIEANKPSPRTLILRNAFWLFKHAGRAAARPFFLKKSTKFVKLPQRPMVEPFWRQYAPGLPARLRDTFERKLAGDVLNVPKNPWSYNAE